MLPVLASPAMGFGILMIPLLDTLRVFSLRIMKKRSPFSPDRTHLHHMLLDRGLSHRTITLSIGVFALLFVLASYLTLPMGATKVIIAQVAVFFLGIYILNSKKRLNLVKRAPKKTVTLMENEDQYAESIFNPAPGSGIFAQRAETIEEDGIR